MYKNTLWHQHINKHIKTYVHTQAWGHHTRPGLQPGFPFSNTSRASFHVILEGLSHPPLETNLYWAIIYTQQMQLFQIYSSIIWGEYCSIILTSAKPPSVWVHHRSPKEPHGSERPVLLRQIVPRPAVLGIRPGPSVCALLRINS